jgi:hypothetical protein
VRILAADGATFNGVEFFNIRQLGASGLVKSLKMGGAQFNPVVYKINSAPIVWLTL